MTGFYKSSNPLILRGIELASVFLLFPLRDNFNGCVCISIRNRWLRVHPLLVYPFPWGGAGGRLSGVLWSLLFAIINNLRIQQASANLQQVIEKLLNWS